MFRGIQLIDDNLALRSAEVEGSQDGEEDRAPNNSEQK